MATQRFCLRWNNHQTNMLSVFDQLLHAETFTDVTLAVEGQLLKAHKMVLSACSPYFQALFVNHQEKHPIVILKDVPYSDMKSLLDFMYRGEVSVDQERLTAFLKVAESLRIKGLTEVNEEKCDIPALTNSLIQQQQTNTGHTPPPQLHRIHPYAHQKRPASGIPSGGAPPNLLMPLLGNALMQPKRKRGRPRKLSGSSSDALNTAASPPGEFIPESASHASSNRAGDQLLRGSPEMLEVKMSMDGFNAEDGATSGGEDGGEALMIDEGDDAQSNEAPTSGKDSESAEYHYTYEDDGNSIPIITLEVLSGSSGAEYKQENLEHIQQNTFEAIQDTGVHFLTEKLNKDEINENKDQENTKEVPKVRNDLLEYMTRKDGSVVCKLCGEILQSRTHWYRHKYKLHVIQPLNPAPLFQCEHCLVYFKSRKGYIGHIASRHSEVLRDSSPVLTNSQAEALAKQTATIQTDIKEEIDPEMSIPKSSVPNYQNNGKQINSVLVRNPENKKGLKNREHRGENNNKSDWEEKRSKEEKLVADIIDRVRRECEAQGSGGAARRGYTRRTTVMHI
ncbi:zinc finger and BTB domain-containing protein 11 isoform X3 [Melitaea cinxia]|uniref:zinc finger and BTB domain-containing protein 11 isoform X3 n=1 Tax=Melitaea cinxia TaxID=113334 RepID=UPI001E270DDC|nr:zinc finger and BTB domain-containing protein 11 isoform X3 [Melitaea cinxia]